MTRGRKQTSTALKKLRGNPGKRKLNQQEPVFEVQIPDAPDFLNEDALKEWEYVTAELAAKQVIAKVDKTSVALYCQTYAYYKKHVNALENETDFLVTPKGYTYLNPRLGLVNTLGTLLAKYAAELGITPASRSKIKMIGKAPAAPTKKQALAEKLFKVPVSK